MTATMYDHELDVREELLEHLASSNNGIFFLSGRWHRCGDFYVAELQQLTEVGGEVEEFIDTFELLDEGEFWRLLAFLSGQPGFTAESTTAQSFTWGQTVQQTDHLHDI